MSGKDIKNIMMSAGDMTYASTHKNYKGIVEFSLRQDRVRATKMFYNYGFEGRIIWSYNKQESFPSISRSSNTLESNRTYAKRSRSS